MFTRYSTEKDCRDFKVPSFETKEELMAFIDSLDNLNHDYGTAAYSMSLAATAAFNYIAHRFGVTGFQASCADLDILRRTRHMEGPFMIINFEDHLYPQYDLRKRLEESIENNKEWFKTEAAKKLAESPNAAPSVIDHWKSLSQGV